ncbi:MAG: pyruvate,water dikinase [Pseudoalteromonas tetraodonis]
MNRPRQLSALSILLIVVGATAEIFAVEDDSFSILRLEKSTGGKYRFEVPTQSQNYYTLYRSRSPSELGVAVAMQQSDTATLWLTDSSLPRDRFFYRVRSTPKSNPSDIDNDGFTDLTELNDLGRLNPFNPSAPLAEVDGRLMINDRATFEELSHRDNFPGAQDVREVKFLILDIHTDHPRLFFIDSNTHEYHVFFAQSAAGYTSSHGFFNNTTYFTNTNRRNVAGSLIAHDNYVAADGTKGIYTMQCWPTDPVAAKFLAKAYEMISAGMPFIDGNLAYHPASETQRQLYESELAEYNKTAVNVIQTEDLFANVTYTALNPGEAFGRLRLVTGSENVSARDVVIFRSLPNDLTHVAGVITELPQTPLSHINLKAKQNNTPNAFIKDAANDPAIAPLLDKYVRYAVTSDGFELRLATQSEVEEFFESVRPALPQYPLRNLSVQTIDDLDAIGFNNASAYGSKAANVAELRNIMPNVAPDGYAIPFFFYDEFMKHNDFYDLVQDLLADPLFQASSERRELRLAELRETIESEGVLPTWMIDALADVQSNFSANTTIRMRSSTNNEDLEGFNGAGLYESYTHKPSEGHISKSAKQVWAGLWTYRAFEERDFYRIDHFSAAMGILVHPNYSDERSNGVAVTKNLFDPNWEGYYVNVQQGENLVTNPEEESIPEEFLVADLLFGNGVYEIQYIRFSNQVPAGQTVMSEAEVLNLVPKMKLIQSHFKTLYDGNSAFAMEIEFKVRADGNLAIKQARPWVE